MRTISVTRFGLALGGASAAVYAACVVILAVVPRGTTVWLLNALMHGLDVEPIMRTDMGFGQMAVGILLILALGGLFGALMAAIYNVTVRETA